jgi:hypothetical protein
MSWQTDTNKRIVVPTVSETVEGGFIYKLKKLNINGLNYTGWSAQNYYLLTFEEQKSTKREEKSKLWRIFNPTPSLTYDC